MTARWTAGVGDSVLAAIASEQTQRDANTATLVTTPASATAAALRAALAAPLPTTGSYTYNADGTVASDPDGNTYTWNADGTPKTQTKNGITRTFNWNADGTLASVS